MIHTKVILAVVVCASFCFANDVYLANSSAGANDGSSCANAKAYTYFNSSGNWSATPTGIQIGPGTTVHLCGTITDSLSGNMFTAQGSGSAGNVVTIKFETGASLQSPGESVFINLNSQSYFLIDGGPTCGYKNGAFAASTACNGSIYNTLNGYAGQTCPGGSCLYQVNTKAIIAPGNNIEVRNLQIGPIYIHGDTSDLTFSPPGPGCITNGTGTNYNFHNLIAHDVAWCINAGTSNFNLSYSEIYNADHGIATGQVSDTPVTINSVVVHDNWFHDFSAWDTTDNSFHHDGMHFFSYCDTNVGGNETYCPATIITGVNVYNNVFSGNWGGNTNTNIFFEYNINGNVFNNVSAVTLASGHVLANGFFNCAGGANGKNYFNNTVIGSAGGTVQTYHVLGICGGPSQLIENNVATDSTMLSTNGPFPTNCPYTLPAGAGGGTQECINTGYTLATNAYLAGAGFGNAWGYENCTGASCTGNDFLNFNSGGFAAFESGAPETGGVFEDSVEPNGTYLNATTGAEISGSPTIAAGTNLTSLCTSLGISGNPCNLDITGNARPSSGAWDIGAYQYGSSPGPYVYYVSNAGSDSADGSIGTPWQTVAKVNGLACGTASGQLGPGDQVLFQDGGTWREQLTIPCGGSSGSPITFGTYGSGAAPIISGANVIANGSWTAVVGSVAFAPNGGSVPQTVTLSSATSGATICYTTDGSTPAATTPGTCSHGSAYSAPFSMSSPGNIEALATKASLINSAVTTSTAYTTTNLLVSPTDFTNAAWTLGGTGCTLTATTVIAAAGSVSCTLTQTVSVSTSTTYTFGLTDTLTSGSGVWSDLQPQLTTTWANMCDAGGFTPSGTPTFESCSGSSSTATSVQVKFLISGTGPMTVSLTGVTFHD